MRMSTLSLLVQMLPIVMLLGLGILEAVHATPAMPTQSTARVSVYLPLVSDPPGATRPDVPGTIAFVRDGDIYAYYPRNGLIRLLIPNGREVEFSRDGTQIAFVREDGLYVAAADGSNIRRVVVQTQIRCPRWTDDGTKLLWERPLDPQRDLYREIWTTALLNGTPMRIAIGADPAWAPDGLRVAYVTEPDRETIHNQLRLVNWRGQNDWPVVTRLPANTPPINGVPPDNLPYHRMHAPVWNATGTAIYVPALVLVQVESGYNIWERADATNGGSVFVDELPEVFDAVPSPDRRGVVFRRGSARGDVALTARPVDPRLPRDAYAWAERPFLQEQESFYGVPAWSPDSNAIAVFGCAQGCGLMLLAPNQDAPSMLIRGLTGSDISWGR